MPKAKVNDREHKYTYNIICANTPSKEAIREYKETIFSYNLRRLVPAHQQDELLQAFVDAGLMKA